MADVFLYLQIERSKRFEARLEELAAIQAVMKNLGKEHAFVDSYIH